MGMFFEEHAKLLSDFARVSQSTGARADYVQGGGGNTSVKLPGGLMAIKASGFCLSDIHPDKAYAVLDGADLRNFYLTTDPSALADVEKEGSARAKADVRHIDGLADLRPSVEAGFHPQDLRGAHAQRLCQSRRLFHSLPSNRGTGIRGSQLHLGLGALHRSRRKPDLRHSG